MVTEQLAELVGVALSAAAAESLIATPVPTPQFERPKNREHGDWSCNVALVAGSGQGNPRELAQALVKRLPDSALVDRAEIAGPGFINFFLSAAWLHEVLRRAADPQSGFGRSSVGAGKTINVEFVSANPTGPINVVSGRHAAYGDAVANLLTATGHAVTREFYVNDAGRQVLLFGRSVAARYLQHHGRTADVPEDGYQGDYIAEVAKDIAAEVGERYVDAADDERNAVMLEAGLARMRTAIEASLARFGTRFDVWFSERSLHESGAVKAGVEALTEKRLTEERDGALWFLSSRLGDDKDRVLVRANGESTYLASDVAYVADKFGRGFDHLIYVWGADHHGTVARLLAVAEALGLDHDAVEIRLIQVVTLSSEGQTLKGSKRAGVIVTLDELLDEVGVDAARYTFLTRSIDAPLEFDIELVKQQAPENPVYYVQYAHARICSILSKASAEGIDVDPTGAPLDQLVHAREDELMRRLAAYEEVVIEAAELRAPQRIARYVEELASDFSSFYRDCKVITEDRALSSARLALCEAVRAVIAQALGVLGVAAPEKM